MGNGEWGMRNGEWGMGNAECGMRNEGTRGRGNEGTRGRGDEGTAAYIRMFVHSYGLREQCGMDRFLPAKRIAQGEFCSRLR